MALAPANKKTWNPEDTGGHVIECDASKVVDNIFVYASTESPTGKVERVIDQGQYRASWAGIFPDGTNKLSLLNAVLAKSEVTTVIFDDFGGGDITVSGTILATTKTLKFNQGVKLIGIYAISGGIIDANPTDYIFGGTPTLSGISGTSDGVFYVDWMGPSADGVTNDYSKISMALSSPIPQISFLKSGTYLFGSDLTFDVDKTVSFAPGVILKGTSNRSLIFKGYIIAGNNQQFIDPTTTYINVAKGSFNKINVKWFGAKGDGVTDDTAAVQKASNAAYNYAFGSSNNRTALFFPTGDYLCDNIYVISDVIGAGSTSTVRAFTAGQSAFLCGYADGYYPNIAWDFHEVRDISILGGKVSNGIIISNNGVPPGNQYAGRWVFKNVGFKDCVKGISKIAGNIGNRYIDCSFSGGEYHYHAVANVSPVMHTGNDYFYHCHFSQASKACMYINHDQNGGGHHVNDCIMESNPGFALFIAAYGNSLFPFVFENVYLENNGTAATTNIDGTDYTGNFIYGIINTKNIIFRNTAMMNRFIDLASVIIWEGCNEYIQQNPPVKDNLSVEYSTKGLGFSIGTTSNTFHIDPPISDPDSSCVTSWIGRVPTAPVPPSTRWKMSMSGANPTPATQTILAANGMSTVSDGGILFGKAIEVASSAPTIINVNSPQGSATVGAAKFIFTTVALKKISGTATAKVFLNSNISTLAETNNTEWTYFSKIFYQANAGAGYIQVYKGDVVFRWALISVIEFDTFMQAYQYAIRNVFMTDDKVANLSVGLYGGQTLTGGNSASENLVLASTSNATKGYIGISSGDVLKLPSQSLRGTPEVGAFEFNGTDLYYDFSAVSRRKFQMDDSISANITGNSSVVIPTGAAVTSIVLSSASTQTNLLVGTTPGGSELGSVDFTGGTGSVILTGVYGTGSNSVYFTNISGTVTYKINLKY